jgi:hypothetical protein
LNFLCIDIPPSYGNVSLKPVVTLTPLFSYGKIDSVYNHFFLLRGYCLQRLRNGRCRALTRPLLTSDIAGCAATRRINTVTTRSHGVALALLHGALRPNSFAALLRLGVFPFENKANTDMTIAFAFLPVHYSTNTPTHLNKHRLKIAVTRNISTHEFTQGTPPLKWSPQNCVQRLRNGR